MPNLNSIACLNFKSGTFQEPSLHGLEASLELSYYIIHGVTKAISQNLHFKKLFVYVVI